MKLSNSLVKLPELSKTMQAMSQEMMKVSHSAPPPLVPYPNPSPRR